jgi:hypothetical protein
MEIEWEGVVIKLTVYFVCMFDFNFGIVKIYWVYKIDFHMLGRIDFIFIIDSNLKLEIQTSY